MVVLILLCRCITWILTKYMEKKLDSNYTRMLWAVSNKFWRQHLTNQQLYGHLTPITKTIQVRRTRHAGYCWRSKDELISNILLWTPSHRRAKVGQLARSYIQQLCADTGCSLEDLPGVMDSSDGWWKKVREIRASSATWWWYISVDTCGKGFSISACFQVYLISKNSLRTSHLFFILVGLNIQHHK